MKKRSIFLFTVLISCSIAVAQQSDKWHITKSTHFIIYYKTAEEKFLGQLIDTAEDCYNKIAEDLGFRRYNFWLWDNRAKIYIYDDAKDYQAGTGQPDWSAGCAATKEKIIHTYPYAQGFFESILPHEMGHIIFREFVGFDNNAIPLWLDEGVASYQERIRRQSAHMLIVEAVQNNKLLNLEKLFSFNPQVIQDRELVNLFYAESLSIVDYLIKEFGTDNFVLFCQGLRDKQDLTKALNYAYPFRDIQDLDKAWQRYLDE